MAIIVSDMSIKNQVATLIAHIYIHNNSVIKTLYYAINVTFTEAELFAIRCDINQATNFNNIAKIIVVTDSIYAARKIFDPSVYLYQIQLAAILSELCNFFNRHENNTIEFWECPSHLK